MESYKYFAGLNWLLILDINMSVCSPNESEQLLVDPTRLDYPHSTGFVQYPLCATITHFAWPIIYYKAIILL